MFVFIINNTIYCILFILKIAFHTKYSMFAL
nr:MAG TPA: hypothetical protein [Caudoviricetes sp.]